MRKRNCRVEVCFTKDELSVLSKKAKKAGLSIGGFVRRSVADKEIKEAPPADIPMLLRAMRQAGYNLDQTLKRFNTTNVPDMPQFRKGLEEIRAATKMVSDAYTPPIISNGGYIDLAHKRTGGQGHQLRPQSRENA